VLLSVRHENHLLGHLLKGLPSSERAALEMELKEFLPRQGSVLQQASELIELIHFPHGGIVSLWTIVDGKAVDAAMVGREGAIGIEASLGESSSFTRAVVQVPATMTCLSAHRLRRIVCESESLSSDVGRHLGRMLNATRQAAACNSIHHVEHRLCRFLLEVSDRTESATVPFTQELLARMLGVQRTTVTLVLSHLEQRGLLANRRGRIAIIDRAAMERGACECYGVRRRVDGQPMR